MRHVIALLSLCALACGSSQPESPMSPKPNAQQAAPTGTAPQEQTPPSSPSPESGMQAPPAPGMPTPSTPRTPTLDAATPPQMPTQPPSQPSAANAPTTTCKVDSDCEAVDDMCGMCRCLSLTKGSAPPVCQEPKVQCIMAPCRGKRPVCKSGACALIDASSGAM